MATYAKPQNGWHAPSLVPTILNQIDRIMSFFQTAMFRLLRSIVQSPSSCTTWAAVAFVLLAMLGPYSRAQGDPMTADAPARSSRSQAGINIEKQVAAVYDQVSPAAVRVRYTHGNTHGGAIGVIVTEGGHVLSSLATTLPMDSTLTFQLPDGRLVTGATLGWSEEWGIGMAKLNGPGPWPHVPIASSDFPKLGQCLVTLAYPATESPETISRPLLDVNWVKRSAPGLWFMTPEVEISQPWHDQPVAFNLDGQLLGLGTGGYFQQGAYIGPKVIRALWDDLEAGKNLDKLRLDRTRGKDDGNKFEPARKQPISQTVKEKVRAASVRIRKEPDKRGWSGTIITAEGLIATCAHHFVMPRTKVVVCLPDGRDAAAEVMGVNLICDIALVRILDSGVYPHLDMGDSVRLRPGASCLFAGYGPTASKARFANVRESSIVDPPRDFWSHLLCTDPAKPFIGGDSGGGVFDADGHLVAIHKGIGEIGQGEPSTPHTNPRVELFREHWDELNAPFEQTADSPLAPIEAELQRIADGVRLSVVDVLDDDKLVALGTVVGTDGRIITKASVLGEAPQCRIADGRVLPAKVVKTLRQHDLAFLKIDALLPSVRWSESGDPSAGMPLAVATGKGPSSLCFISNPVLSFTSENARLWGKIRDGAQGVEVTELFDLPLSVPAKAIAPQLLLKGDAVLSIDGHTTPNTDVIAKLLDTAKGDSIAVAGDPVRLVVARDGKHIELRQVLGPPPWLEGQSARRSGFSRVYSVAVRGGSNLCGGPVVNRDGRAIGVAIASRNKGWLLVLPAAIAKDLPAE